MSPTCFKFAGCCTRLPVPTTCHGDDGGGIGQAAAVSWPPLSAAQYPCPNGWTMCASSALGVVAVTCRDTSSVVVYALRDGARLFDVPLTDPSTRDSHPSLDMPFDCGGMCFSPSGTLLIALDHQHCVAEVAVTPPTREVRRRIVDSELWWPVWVHCNDTLLAVTQAPPGGIALFAWPSGARVRTIAHPSFHFLRGVRLLADGAGVAVADMGGGAVVVMSLTGKLVCRLTAAGGLQRPFDVVERGEAGGGYLIASAEMNAVLGLTLDDAVTDAVAAPPNVFGGIASGGDGGAPSESHVPWQPRALAVLDDGGVVVRGLTSFVVCRGIRLRLVWIAAAVCVGRRTAVV